MDQIVVFDIETASPPNQIIVPSAPLYPAFTEITLTASATGNYNLYTGTNFSYEGDTVREIVTCGFPSGTLQLVKRATGGDGTFAFTTTSTALANPTLTTNSGMAQTPATAVAPGTYTLTEAAAAGWNLSSIACTGNAAPAAVSLPTRSVTVTVAANEAVVCTFTNASAADRTEAIIKNYMTDRGERIASNGPSVGRLIDRLSDDPAEAPQSLKDDPPHRPMKLGRGEADPSAPRDRAQAAGDETIRGRDSGVTVAGQATSQEGRVSVATSLAAIAKARAAEDAGQDKMRLGAAGPASPFRQPRFDVWLEGTYEFLEHDKAAVSGHFGLLMTGIDYKVTPGLLVGVMVQHDTMEEKSAALGYLVKGQGWMAGPYAAARISRNLFLDGRVLWGRSDNQVSPFLTYTDSFETSRWLGALRLTGRWQHGPWALMPSAEVVRYSEASKAYVDSNGLPIDSQKVDIGRVIFGPEVSYTFTTQDGTRLSPRVAVRGLWDFDKPGYSALATSTIPPASSDWHARLEAGLTLRRADGVGLEFSGAWEGLGSDGTDVKSMRGRLNVPLN